METYICEIPINHEHPVVNIILLAVASTQQCRTYFHFIITIGSEMDNFLYSGPYHTTLKVLYQQSHYVSVRIVLNDIKLLCNSVTAARVFITKWAKFSVAVLVSHFNPVIYSMSRRREVKLLGLMVKLVPLNLPHLRNVTALSEYDEAKALSSDSNLLRAVLA